MWDYVPQVPISGVISRCPTPAVRFNVLTTHILYIRVMFSTNLHGKVSGLDV